MYFNVTDLIFAFANILLLNISLGHDCVLSLRVLRPASGNSIILTTMKFPQLKTTSNFSEMDDDLNLLFLEMEHNLIFLEMKDDINLL